jgi:DNA repair exonuclease SbcCD ATPase subunit
MINPEPELTIKSSNVDELGYNLQWSRFRKVKSFEINLPLTGILLLDGRSGIGKTTIFEAISFALHDNGGNDIYPRSEKASKKKKDSTWVQLTFPDGLTIYRQRRPNLLRVGGRGVDLTDASAQSYLNRIVGSLNNWLVGGYLRQWELCAFFTMSSDDKLSLIQRISTSDQFTRDISPEQFDLLLNKTHERILALSKLQELEMQVKVCAEMYMRVYNGCSDEVKSQNLWSPEITASHLQTYNAINLKDLLSKAKTQSYVKANSLRSMISETQIQIASINENNKQRERLEKMLDKNEKDLEEYPDDIADEISLCERELNDITEQINLAKRTERRSQLLSAKTQIQQRLDVIPDEISKYTSSQLDQFDRILSGSSIEYIEDQLKELILLKEYRQKLVLYQKYQNTLFNVNNLQKQLESYPKESVSNLIEEITRKIWTLNIQKKKLTCPTCSTSLQLTDGKLTPLDHVHDQVVEKEGDLNFQKSRLQQNEVIFQQRFHVEKSLKLAQDQLAITQVVINLPSKPKLIDFNHDIDYTINQLNESKKSRNSLPLSIDVSSILIERKKLTNTYERNRLKSDIESISKELNNLVGSENEMIDTKIIESNRNSIITKLSKLRIKHTHRATLLAAKEQLMVQLKNYPRKDSCHLRVQKLQDELDMIIRDFETFEKDINAQIQLTQLSELYNQHSQYNSLHQDSIKRLMALQKIKSTLITAEYIILDTVLTEINNTIAEVLDILFINPISVTIRTLRQLKTDDRIKPQINCQIISEGSECSSIMGLSGGERIKVSLALAIAFSKFSDAPFFILDESLSTLDAVTKESTIKMLRHYLPNKLIMTVNHDTTVGVYNSVISLS